MAEEWVSDGKEAVDIGGQCSSGMLVSSDPGSRVCVAG